MKCAQCKNNVIQKANDGGLKFRIDGPMTMTVDGILKARCHWCGTEVELPFILTRGFFEERFVIMAGSGPGSGSGP